jgi:hypothetical protein
MLQPTDLQLPDETPDDEDDPLGARAVMALARMIDNRATLEDLRNYRAWLTKLRLEGWPEEALRTGTLIVDQMAEQLGVA